MAFSHDCVPIGWHLWISCTVLVLQKSTLNFVKKIFLLKKDFNHKWYIYIFCFFKPIKLYIEPGIQYAATAKHKHGNPTFNSLIRNDNRA